MSGSFSVTPADLQGVANGLSSVGGQLTELAKAPSTDPAALGGGNLESDLVYFFHRYALSISRLDGHLENVINNMQQAAINYQTTDACVAEGAQWTVSKK